MDWGDGPYSVLIKLTQFLYEGLRILKVAYLSFIDRNFDPSLPFIHWSGTDEECSEPYTSLTSWTGSYSRGGEGWSRYSWFFSTTRRSTRAEHLSSEPSRSLTQCPLTYSRYTPSTLPPSLLAYHPVTVHPIPRSDVSFIHEVRHRSRGTTVQSLGFSL